MSFEVEQLADNVSTTLNGGINAVVTSLVVMSATGFPTLGVFRIIIDGEVIKITARSGTTLTGVRGDGGTTAATHSNGAAVTIIQTADAVRALLVDAVGHPLYTYPYLADFSWINQGGATADDDDRGIYLTTPGVVGDNLRILEQASPSTPYVLTAKTKPFLLVPSATLFTGIGFRESGTGKAETLSITSGTGPDAYFSVEHWNSATNFNSTPFVQIGPYRGWITDPWLRIRDDGTNLYFDVSTDGYKFTNLRTEARGSFFTIAPDRIFTYVNANNATNVAAHRLLSWAKT